MLVIPLILILCCAVYALVTANNHEIGVAGQRRLDDDSSACEQDVYRKLQEFENKTPSSWCDLKTQVQFFIECFDNQHNWDSSKTYCDQKEIFITQQWIFLIISVMTNVGFILYHCTNYCEDNKKVLTEDEVDDDKIVAQEAIVADKPRPNFAGTWERTKCDNLDVLLEVLGSSYLERKLLPQVPIMHSISTDEETHEESIFIHEKASGGMLDIKTSLIIGGDAQHINVYGNEYLQEAYWNEDKLIMHRAAKDQSHELIIIRWVEKKNGNENVGKEMENEEQCFLTIIYKDSKQTVTATETYKRVGPCLSTIQAPVVDKVKMDAHRTKALIAASNSSETPPKSTTSTSNTDPAKTTTVVPKNASSAISALPIANINTLEVANKAIAGFIKHNLIPLDEKDSSLMKPRADSEPEEYMVLPLRTVLQGVWRELGDANTIRAWEDEEEKEEEEEAKENHEYPQHASIPAGVYHTFEFVQNADAPEIETLQITTEYSGGHIQKCIVLPVTGEWVRVSNLTTNHDTIAVQAYWEGFQYEEDILVVRSQFHDEDEAGNGHEVYEKYSYDIDTQQLQVVVERTPLLLPKGSSDAASVTTLITGCSMSILFLEKISS